MENIKDILKGIIGFLLSIERTNVMKISLRNSKDATSILFSK